MRPVTALTWLSIVALLTVPRASSQDVSEVATVTASARLDPSSPEFVPQAEEPPLVAWREVADKPCRWLGRKVRVRLQYASEPAAWNPYLTRFGSGQFDAVEAWSDEQFPWNEDEFRFPAARVFVRKGSPSQHELVGAETYARYEVTLIVREVFLDQPWAEIVAVRPMLDRISEATVIHAARALELMGQGAWTLAGLEFEAALSAPLPDAATVELVRLRDVCAEQAREASTPRNR